MSSLCPPATTLVPTFERWWQCSGVWVEPFNRRRKGESGVQLLGATDDAGAPLYSKRQTGHLYRSLLHPLGRPTILRELKAYRALARLGVGVPRLVYGSVRRHEGQWQALLVTEALQGFLSLEQWYAQAHAALHRRSMLGELAATLARMHLNRWQHGSCYAKHIFLKLDSPGQGLATVRVALLDLEKSRRRWRAKDAARHDLQQLYRHRGAMPDADWALLQSCHAAWMGAG